MENHRQKRKRAKKRTYIARGGILLGVEGAFYAQAAQIGLGEGAVNVVAERPQRVPRKCSICKSTEHNARICPRRQVTS